MKIDKIILYDEPVVPEIQLNKIAKFLKKTLSAKIEIKNNFFEYQNIEISKKIIKARIFNLKKPLKNNNSVKENILIKKENNEVILYDGFELQKIITENISINENKINILHIIFTEKMTCTFDENDFRYHARTWVGSNPAIISTTGIIEAPAKPKQYYLDLLTNFSQKSTKDIKKKYRGQFLGHHDSRISEIIEGIVLQIIIYYESGESFCQYEYCRLFNAHWQKELLFSQVENKKFCEKHQKILNELRE